MIRTIPVRKMTQTEFKVEYWKIPKDHKVVLSSLAEFGKLELSGLIYAYIHTHEDDKQKLIDVYTKAVELIKTGNFDELDKLGVE